MAFECEFTIIYFTLIVLGSMSITIDRNVCLETVTRFLNHKDECNFNSNTIEDILQDDTTCPNKCNFRIYNLYSGRYSLKYISLAIGNYITIFNPCSGSYKHYKSLFINCSSWNAREYIIRNDVGDCFINDSQCVRIYNYCICHCLPGYILEDKKCLKKCYTGFYGVSCKKTCGNCRDVNQCDRSNGTCLTGCLAGYMGDLCQTRCQSGFFGQDCSEKCIDTCNGCNDVNGLCDYGCIPGWIGYFCNKECDKGSYGFECNETCGHCRDVNQCSNVNGSCLTGCNAGYKGELCKSLRVNIGGICEHNWQCNGTEFANVCDDGLCVCNSGYIQIDRKCYQDTNIGVKLGTLFGGLILGLIVIAVVTTLMYRRYKFPTRKRQEPDVMFADNRTYGAASDGQTSFSNDTKVATVSLYSFSKETPGYKKQENRTEDVYNHLH